MKILDKYILKSYLTRFIGVFAICFLIFIIQTFWLYIDELAGKGLDIFTIGKFFMYFSPKLVPLVLPLSILLASFLRFIFIGYKNQYKPFFQIKFFNILNFTDFRNSRPGSKQKCF